jgi:hypothetical protein
MLKYSLLNFIFFYVGFSMNIHKIFAMALLLSLMPHTAQSYFDTGVSIQISLTKQTLLMGAAVGGSILAGFSLYRLYCHFFVMTLPKAEKLCNEVSAYIEEMTSKYHRELDLIDKGFTDEALKVELQNIITDSDSESPYLTYNNALREAVRRAESYEEKYRKCIPQLETAMNKIHCKRESSHLYSSGYSKVEAQLQQYGRLFESIAGLRELLHSLRFKMQRLVRLCMQFDAYRQEKMLARLQAIERQLIINSMRSETVYYCY